MRIQTVFEDRLPRGREIDRRTALSNMLLMRALEDLLAELGEDCRLLLLKGAALLAGDYLDYGDRPMGDIDLLLRPQDALVVERALTRLGFKKYPSNPNLYRRDGIAFDLHESVWYLTDEELAAFWSAARRAPIGESAALIPASSDLLIHVLAHAAIHHGELEPKWINDVRRILEKDRVHIRLNRTEQELRRLGLYPAVCWFLEAAEIDLGWGTAAVPRWLGRLDVRFKGHFLRFWFLRDWGFRARYALRSLFPSARFIRARYDVENPASVALFSVIRPLLLALNAITALMKLGPRLRRGWD